MSKFFAARDEFSSSEDESSSDETPQEKVVQKATVSKKRFYNDDSDYSDEEQTRVVKKTSDKRTEMLQNVFDKMKNHIKISDFSSLQEDFEKIQDELEKCAGNVFATDKFQTLPSWVLKNLMAFEDCINEVTNEEKKKMNKTNAQAFNKVRQKFRKFLAEDGDDENTYDSQLKKYRENPSEEESDAAEEEDEDDSDDSDSDSSDSDSSSSSSSDEDSDEPKTKKKAPVKKAQADSSSEEDDSSSSSSSSDDSDSSSDDDDKSDSSESEEEEILESGQLPKKYAFLALPRDQMTLDQKRWKWVKFENLPEDMKQFIRPATKKTAADKEKAKQKKAGESKKEEIKEHFLEIEDDKELDFTKIDNVEKILTKYKNQQTSRRNFDARLHLEVLTTMLTAQQENLQLKIEILMLLTQTFFATAKTMPQGYFPREMWLKAKILVESLLENLKLKPIVPKKAKAEKQDGDDEGGDLDQFQESSDAQIHPALVNFIEKLDGQLTKAFQTTHVSQMGYLHRIRDECILIRLCDEAIEFMNTQEEPQKAAQIGLIKLDRIYYKNDFIYERTKKLMETKPDDKKFQDVYYVEDSQKVVADLVEKVLKNCTLKYKIKATLLQVYHHAIHNRYSMAKDLIMKAKLQQTIGKQQISNQICFNRAIVQIGLSAFRTGLFDECFKVLEPVCQSPKLKESLAQGINSHTKNQEKTLEEELEEKKRFIPPHLQINLEVLDCVFMTTSMLLEIPNISQNKFTIKQNVISRNFRKLIDQYDSKGIQFMAQNSRDYIVFAARSLHQSHWQDAFNNICQIKIFQKMREFQNGSLKTALLNRFKEEALRIFLIESQNQYESLSIARIQDQFKIEEPMIIRQVSRLIMKKQLNAKIENQSQTVIYEKPKPVDNKPGNASYENNDRQEMFHLQNLYLEKISNMVEANERCMDLLINQNYYIQYKDKDKNQHHNQGHSSQHHNDRRNKNN